MTTDSADDDSPGEDQEPVVDTESTAATAPSGFLPGLKTKRARNKALREEMEKRLGSWSFFSGHEADAPIQMTVEGDYIGKTSGDGEAIGLMIVRICKLFSALGAKPQLERLSFAKSVTVEFRAPDLEAARAQEKLESARRLSAAAGNSPSSEQADAINRALRGAVTDILVASQLASDLVAVPSTEAPEVAVGFGTDVASAYKTLANAVAHADVTLTIKAPAHEPIELTPAKASRVVEELRASTEPRETKITAFGTLSIANQEQHGFGLRLDRDATRHALLKGKRVVNGVYLPEVEAKIRDGNLWGAQVRATLLVVRDALISTSTVRPPEFTLIDVEPRNSAG